MDKLRKAWNELCSRYTNNYELVNELWAEVVEKYSAKKRYYHNLAHLQYMVEKTAIYKDSLSDFDILLFSIFYHDIVYSISRQDNELKSAQVARDRMGKLGIPDRMLNKCSGQIIATKDHKENTDTDTNFLLDMDLAILGESPELYKQYTANIRKEYAIYPDFLYRKGRKKVLQHFLNMACIFKTEVFQSRYEEQARENLELELSVLFFEKDTK